MEAPICWMGGKHYLRYEIIKRLPAHTCYVEVFGGAAWVLFAKGPSKVEVYNDINRELVNFYRVIKNAHRAFIQAYDWILVSRRLFGDFRRTPVDELDEIQRAVRFYYLIRASFAGKGDSFGYKKTDLPPMNIENIYETVSGVYNRLKHVYIEEGDFEELIARYDGPETVFFVDPPYYGTAEYTCKMDDADYIRLRNSLHEMRGKFLLTINDCDYTRALLDGFETEEVEVPYSISRTNDGRGRYGELMVRNYGIEGRLF